MYLNTPNKNKTPESDLGVYSESTDVDGLTLQHRSSYPYALPKPVEKPATKSKAIKRLKSQIDENSKKVKENKDSIQKSDAESKKNLLTAVKKSYEYTDKQIRKLTEKLDSSNSTNNMKSSTRKTSESHRNLSSEELAFIYPFIFEDNNKDKLKVLDSHKCWEIYLALEEKWTSGCEGFEPLHIEQLCPMLRNRVGIHNAWYFWGCFLLN